jgi:hypothetical protein
MRTLIERQHEHQLSRDEMSFLGGTLFGAAVDNVNSLHLGLVININRSYLDCCGDHNSYPGSRLSS